MNMTTVPSNQLKAMQQEIADLKEQLAQLRIEADFNFDQYQDAGRLLCDLQEIAEQQAEAIRLKDVAIIFAIEHEDALDRDNRWYTLTKALSIQPSPETLQARDKRVAEACAKVCIEQSEGIARSTPVSRDRVHTLVENTMFKGIARPAPVRDCSESSVRESAFRIRNGAWERHF